LAAAVWAVSVEDVDAQSFTPTGSLTTSRGFLAANVLPNGEVLVTGGQGLGGTFLSSAELYDPNSGVWRSTEDAMEFPRDLHTATLLRDGRVLVAGGHNGMAANDSAELYDPATGFFAPAATMTQPRYGHTATLLSDGTVLLAGGSFGGGITDTAEIFDTATQAFSLLPSRMTRIRVRHSATRLPSGLVLIAGGGTGLTVFPPTAELYDPASRTFRETTGPMRAARYDHSATLLSGGFVLLAGGYDNVDVLVSGELYDPAADSFSLTNGHLFSPRRLHTATRITDGSVLIAGGESAIGGAALNTGEIYNPATRVFRTVGSTMSSPRYGHVAASLGDGKVLLAGGANPISFVTNSADLFESAGVSVPILSGPLLLIFAAMLAGGGAWLLAKE
jgi:hypothetical protein